ncbi:unnamed protein product [Trichogramma brassicae]|uniref:Uncharacterized protein n=1 Tax=Trichogramma brassicae TaxID=86971 RepID=A0A6H5IMT6_9HYME|nr:unnamed protein product [Trichogramma brassicae]
MPPPDDRSYEYDDLGRVKPYDYECTYTIKMCCADKDERDRRKCYVEMGDDDPNSPNKDGLPFLHQLCRRLGGDDVDLVEWLLTKWTPKNPCRQQPVQINARDQKFGWTALHWAAYNGLPRTTDLLLSRGAKPNLVDDEGQTPLHVICRIDKYHTSIQKEWLTEYVCDQRVYDRLWAFAGRQRAIVESLLRGGADPNAADARGFTPLHVLCRKKCDDDYLRSTKGDRKLPLPPNLTPYRDHRGAIESMLRHGANPNLANKERSTPLHLICKGYGDNRELAEMLFGACDQKFRPYLRVDVRDDKGETPLDLAKKNGNDNLRIVRVHALIKENDRNSVRCTTGQLIHSRSSPTNIHEKNAASGARAKSDFFSSTLFSGFTSEGTRHLAVKAGINFFDLKIFFTGTLLIDLREIQRKKLFVIFNKYIT